MGRAARASASYFRALIASFVLAMGMASAAVPLAAPGAGTTPKASLHCGYARYHSEIPLGGVIVNQIDKPGPHGNEVNDIFGVMNGYEIIGWLYTSFDGSAMFEPLAEPGFSTFRLGAKMPKERSFNVAPLLHAAFDIQPKWPNTKFAKTVMALRGQPKVEAQVIPCFVRPWNGLP